jgi:hypothetical protein
MDADDKWWKRRPYLWAFLFSLIAAITGLVLDIVLTDRSLADALPPRLFHFVVLFTILGTIEWVKRRFFSSHD